MWSSILLLVGAQLCVGLPRQQWQDVEVLDSARVNCKVTAVVTYPSTTEEGALPTVECTNKCTFKTENKDQTYFVGYVYRHFDRLEKEYGLMLQIRYNRGANADKSCVLVPATDDEVILSTHIEDNSPCDMTTVPSTTLPTTLPSTTLPTTLPPTTTLPTTLPYHTEPWTTVSTTLPYHTELCTTEHTTLPVTHDFFTTQGTTTPPSTISTTLPYHTEPSTVPTTVPITHDFFTTFGTTLPPTTISTTLPYHTEPTTVSTTMPITQGTVPTTLPSTIHTTEPITHNPIYTTTPTTLPPTPVSTTVPIITHDAKLTTITTTIPPTTVPTTLPVTHDPVTTTHTTTIPPTTIPTTHTTTTIVPTTKTTSTVPTTTTPATTTIQETSISPTTTTKLPTTTTTTTTTTAPTTTTSWVCGSDWVLIGTACFHLSEVRGDWSEGRDYCAGLGATLASIRTQEEQDGLAGLVDANAWIGLHDMQSEGEHRWEDQTTLSYSNWQPGQPDNSGTFLWWGSGEDCVEMNLGYSLRWNDQDCDNENMYICRSNAELQG